MSIEEIKYQLKETYYLAIDAFTDWRFSIVFVIAILMSIYASTSHACGVEEHEKKELTIEGIDTGIVIEDTEYDDCNKIIYYSNGVSVSTQLHCLNDIDLNQLQIRSN